MNAQQQAELERARRQWRPPFLGAARRPEPDVADTVAIDYAPFPLGLIVDDLLLEALDTGEALREEGAAMHHCVASYIGDVRSGRSRIYSIRRGEKRVATLELRRSSASVEVAQLRGPCNAKVDLAIQAAASRMKTILNRIYLRPEKVALARARGFAALTPYEQHVARSFGGIVRHG